MQKKMMLAITGMLLLGPTGATAQTSLPAAPALHLEDAGVELARSSSAQAEGTAKPAQMAVSKAESTPGGPSLTREQAEAMALSNNPRITVSHLLSLAQAQVVRQSRSGELPQFNGNLLAEDGYSGSRYPSATLSDSRLLRHVGGGVSLAQLITDFGRTHNLVAASRLQVQAEQATEQATREDVILVTDQAFYQSLRAQASLRVAEQAVSQRQAVQSQVTQLTKNNLRSTLDASFADVNVSQAQLLLLDAQDAQDAAMADLDAVLGLDHEETYVLVDDAQEAAPAPPADVDVLVAMALKQRPDLQSLVATRDAQKKLSRAQSEQQLPTLSALGTVGGQPVRDGRYVTSSWDGAVAANLQVPIFNGFLFSAQAKETDLRAQATDAQAVALRDVITRDVRTAWLEANNSFRRIGVTAELLTQANQSLKLAQARYTLGLSSIVELSQAQLQQTQASIGYANAAYSYRAALSALQFQIGAQR